MANENEVERSRQITIAREYFVRADEGRSDILELFHEDAEIYSQSLDLDLDGNLFSRWLKDSKDHWNTFGTIIDTLTFIPSGDYLVVEGTSHGNMCGKYWAGGVRPDC